MLAQSVHGAFAFAQEHPHITKDWMNISNYICILEIDNEPALVKLWEKAKQENIANSCFVEPDFNNSLTAIALAPGPESKKLCSDLKLALK
jgi:hypothetical protein